MIKYVYSDYRLSGTYINGQVVKFRDAIEYEFKFWVKERFRRGYEEYNMDQDTIVKAILRGLKVRNNKDNYEMIKKIDYRKRRTKEEIDFKNLLCVEKSEF